MDWFEDEVRALEQQPIEPVLDPAPVAFYGSSSVRLWDTLRSDFPDVGALNLGFGGSTLQACAHFFARIVPPRRPRALLIYAGDNDLGDGRSPDDVLASLCDLLHQADTLLGPIPLAFLSIKPSPARWHLDNQIRRANALARIQVEARRNSVFVDVFPRMLGADSRPRSEFYAEDGLHLSRSGYRLWTETILEHSHLLF